MLLQVNVVSFTVSRWVTVTNSVRGLQFLELSAMPSEQVSAWRDMTRGDRIQSKCKGARQRAGYKYHHHAVSLEERFYVVYKVTY